MLLQTFSAFSISKKKQFAYTYRPGKYRGKPEHTGKGEQDGIAYYCGSR
jgi:hypothetical protein